VVLLVVDLVMVGYFFWLRSSRNKSEETKTFLCPVPAEYCDSGRIIEIDGAYVGVGYQVPEGTPILAALPGQVKNSRTTFLGKTGGGQFVSLNLVDPSTGFNVYYVLAGEDKEILVNVSRGEEILLTRGGEVANFGVSLLVSVVGSDQKKLPLAPDDFVMGKD